MPMVNMLCTGVHEPDGCLKITDCNGHLEDCDKKDARYIADQFKPHMAELDPNGYLIECIFFMVPPMFKKLTGSFKSCILAQLCFMVPIMLCICFSKTSSSYLKLRTKSFDIVYVSCVWIRFNASFYAFFHKQTRQFKNGHDIGLLRVADTRMAGYFTAVHRDLLLKMHLQATVSSVGFLTATQIKKSKDPINTIKD
jgi:hypothetical protein